MQIFALTPLGKSLARSIRSPQSTEWKIIHHLDLSGHASKEQIETYCGLSSGEATSALMKLRHKKVVAEETGEDF